MNSVEPSYWQPDSIGREDECKLFRDYLISRARQRLDRGVGEGGFVVGLQGGYGTGKTFFLKGLRDMLRKDHPVAYLDAWESDSLGDPLMALVDALQRALGHFVDAPGMGDKALSVAGNIGKLGLSVLRGAGKAAVQRYLGNEIGHILHDNDFWNGGDANIDVDAGQDIAAASGDAIDGAISDLRAPVRRLARRSTLLRKAAWDEAQQGLTHLRHALAQIVAVLREAEDLSAPIVIIVDELDRCRPDYAISMLEEIKHFFAVPGLVFVLGMEPSQLAASVSGIYGSNFDGADYLRRFTQFDYTLGTPSMRQFVSRRLELDQIDTTRFADDLGGGTFVDEITRVFEVLHISLRQADQVLERLRICSQAFSGPGLMSATLLATLAIEQCTGKTYRDHLGDEKPTESYCDIGIAVGGLRVDGAGQRSMLTAIMQCDINGINYAKRVSRDGNLSELTRRPIELVAYYLYINSNGKSDYPVEDHRAYLNRVSGFTS